MNNNEQRIRELAHQIWESEGRPDGNADRHWQMAAKLAESEQQGDLQPLPAKKSTTRKPRTKTAAAPARDETQLEKPALLGKPAGAKTPRAQRQPIARTTKVTDLGKPDNGSQE